eukprot:363783-Chlamydomonas_euryale.AAC.3
MSDTPLHTGCCLTEVLTCYAFGTCHANPGSRLHAKPRWHLPYTAHVPPAMHSTYGTCHAKPLSVRVCPAGPGHNPLGFCCAVKHNDMSCIGVPLLINSNSGSVSEAVKVSAVSKERYVGHVRYLRRGMVAM